MLPNNLKKTAAFLLTLLVLTACHLPSFAPTTTNVSPIGPSAPEHANVQAVVPPLSGHVSFGRDRRIQATMTDVLTGSTVSLINTGTNQTVSTALTDSNGNFTLTNFPGGFGSSAPSRPYDAPSWC